MREACKFKDQIHNGNILKSSVTKDPGVSSILLFSGSGINFPRPLYMEIQMRLVAKSYMRKGFLIYEEMRKYLACYLGCSSYMTLQPVLSEFPYILYKKM